MFKRLLSALKKQQAPIKINDNRDNLNHFPGGWMLDYAPIYGGYVIEEEVEGGGISHPFGCMRRSAREMYLSMYMTCMAIEQMNYQKEQMNKLEW